MSVVVQFSTIPEMFDLVTAKFAAETRPMLMYKSEGRYIGITYTRMREKTAVFANGLAALGVKKGDAVAIISENRPEWVIVDQAIAALGAINVPVYPTMTARQNQFILDDAGVKVAILSNQFQLNKVLKVMDELRTLKNIIVMNERVTANENDVLSFEKVMERGECFRTENPRWVGNASGLVRGDDLLTLIYTSGTTGHPKGVMLTHGNLVSNVINAAECINIQPGDRILSFLPLSHSFERMAGYYAAFACGATIAYAESVETVRENMLEVRPTIVPTVPRLFERMHSRVLKQVEGSSLLKRKIFHWAVRIGTRYAAAARRGRVPLTLTLRHVLADRLVYRTLRDRTGGMIKFFISGGAALPRELGEFFEAVGLKIIEGYGLTETSPVLTVNRFESYTFGTVGKAIPGVELRIAGDGEILARGPNIMKGYWNDPKATNEVIDHEGWFHTGDIGMFDAGGNLCITDRKKHLFVSSGGKNIAPQPIENLFLSSKYIEQLVLIGDKRMFLTALIVPDFDAVREYADARRLLYRTNRDLVGLREINELIDGEIGQMQRDLANYERVRKFSLLEKPFTLEEGELTPTQKVRRSVVEERYAHLIDRMYEGIS